MFAWVQGYNLQLNWLFYLNYQKGCVTQLKPRIHSAFCFKHTKNVSYNFRLLQPSLNCWVENFQFSQLLILLK